MRRLKKVPAAAWLGGGIYALLSAFGWQAEHWGKSDPAPALAASLALFIPFALLLSLLFSVTDGERRQAKAFRSGLAFALMLLCWLPSFIVHFPGSFAYDVPFQLEQIASGAYSTHHPLLHTLLLGGCVRLGRLFGSMNAGAALYTALQMLLLAACFTLTCASLDRQAGSRAARGAAVFFALYPLNMLMAVNATKDVLFTGCFVLTFALVRETLCLGQVRAVRLLIPAALSVLLRNNMAYALAAFILLLLLFRQIGPAGLLALALAVSLLCGSLLARSLGAVSGDVREALSVPIQQVARVSCLEREKLTDGEKAAIGDVMPEMIWRAYDPAVSDPVKFGFDSAPLRRDPAKYLSCYLRVLRRCPGCCFDAVLMLDHAFLYPYGRYGVSGYYLQTGITDAVYTSWGEDRITDASPTPRLRAALSWRFGAKGAMQIPLVGWLFNMGLINWTLLFFSLRSLAMRRGNEALASALPLLLLGTFLLGPVMAGRYIYPFVCSLPVAAARAEKKEG
ncbi:MAG: hypothetical protein IJ573_06725 [Clostridia bacterium]|nr:hypothetical protein [Clostridia bacterium]